MYDEMLVKVFSEMYQFSIDYPMFQGAKDDLYSRVVRIFLPNKSQPEIDVVITELIELCKKM